MNCESKLNDKNKLRQEGYRPQLLEKGYKPTQLPSNDQIPKPQSGYQPLTGHGTNPTDIPPGKK